MDVTALSPAINQVNLQTQIGFALLENVKEFAEVQTEALQEMISSVAIPGLGENIDISL